MCSAWYSANAEQNKLIGFVSISIRVLMWACELCAAHHIDILLCMYTSICAPSITKSNRLKYQKYNSVEQLLEIDPLPTSVHMIFVAINYHCSCEQECAEFLRSLRSHMQNSNQQSWKFTEISTSRLVISYYTIVCSVHLTYFAFILSVIGIQTRKKTRLREGKRPLLHSI